MIDFRRYQVMIARLSVAAFVAVMATDAGAAPLDRSTLQSLISAPYSVGERDLQYPIWPIFKRTRTSDELIAYVFEYSDMDPLSSLANSSIIRLVAIKPSGEFWEARLVDPHQPAYLNWMTPKPLFAFMRDEPADGPMTSAGTLVPAAIAALLAWIGWRAILTSRLKA